ESNISSCFASFRAGRIPVLPFGILPSAAKQNVTVSALCHRLRQNTTSQKSKRRTLKASKPTFGLRPRSETPAAHTRFNCSPSSPPTHFCLPCQEGHFSNLIPRRCAYDT